MSLKDLLLARFSRRDSQKGGVVLRPSQPLSEKISALQELVSSSILPRKIVATTDQASLVLTAANRLLFSIDMRIDGRADKHYDFTSSNAVASRGLSEELAAFFAKVGECPVDLTPVNAEFSAKDGVSPGVISPAPPRPQPLSDPSKAKAQPALFLAAAEGEINEARFWSSNGAWPANHANPMVSEVEAGKFSGMEALFATLSPALGSELMFVAISGGNPAEACVVAQNGTYGVVAKLNPQKLGRICHIWQRTSPAEHG